MPKRKRSDDKASPNVAAESVKRRRKASLSLNDPQTRQHTQESTAKPDAKNALDPNNNAVYLLRLLHPTLTRTYLGSTNNFERRMRQHNGEISGGAKTTRNWSFKHRYIWEPICVIRGFPTRAQAYSFEIRAKHIQLSLGKNTPAENGTRDHQGKLLYHRVRKMIIMCNLPRWSKNCPPALNIPLHFEWHDPSYKPATNLPYLPAYVQERGVASPRDPPPS